MIGVIQNGMINRCRPVAAIIRMADLSTTRWLAIGTDPALDDEVLRNGR